MFGLRLAGWIGLALCLNTIANPVSAQRLSAELRDLDAKLPGTLINNPSVIDWEVYGDEVASEPVIDQSIPGGGAALKITTKRADEYIYTAGIKLPLIKSIGRGEQVTIGFYARTISAQTANGKGVVRVRFQEDFEPFSGFGEKTLNIGSDWQWHEVTAKSEFGLDRKNSIVAIQFGRTRQTLEFGQTIIVKGASAIADAPPMEPVEAAAPSLPKSLQGLGTLINDPSKENWHFGSDKGTVEPLPDAAIFGIQASRFAITESGSKPHELFVAIPLMADINEGDELIIAIAGRGNGSISEGAVEAQISVRVEEAKPPYDGFSDNRIALANNWRLVRVRTRADRVLAAGDAQLALHIGGAIKVVDIGPIYVIKLN